MLEALVSSRIRRALLEHILQHPQDSFYLRGLAKQLNLSISPLRRELLRLEHSGMLTAIEEGNLRLYRVNTTNPAFIELTRLGAQDSELRAMAPNPQPPAQSTAAPMLVGVLSAQEQRPWWKRALPAPALVALSMAAIIFLFIVAGMAYLTVVNQRLVVTTQQAVATPRTNVTVVSPTPSPSNGMHSNHWRLVPGTMGGFSSSGSQNDQTY